MESIPCIKVGKVIIDYGKNVRSRFLTKKTYAFFQGFRYETVTQCELQNYRKKLSTNEDYLFKETERIFLILDTLLEEKKAKILGKLYRKYIDEQINYDQFMTISSSINSTLINDFGTLKKYYELTQKDNWQSSDLSDTSTLARLQALGYLSLSINSIFTNQQIIYYVKSEDIGKILASILD